MKIYLAGPIANCTDSECRDWRAEARRLHPDVLDPLDRDYRGVSGNHTIEIVEKDKAAIDAADALLVWYPGPSVGTSMEILYAWEHGKPTAVVNVSGAFVPIWIEYHAAEVFQTIPGALAYLEGLPAPKDFYYIPPVITKNPELGQALDSVMSERRRQDAKWGVQNHDLTVWSAILAEECGEFAEASLGVFFNDGKTAQRAASLAEARTEAVHCAAVAMAIIECIDRRS